MTVEKKIYVLWMILLFFGSAMVTGAESASPVQTVEYKTVFSARLECVNTILDQWKKDLGARQSLLAYFREERKLYTETIAADGPDFSRSIGMVIRTDGKKLVPIYFFPVHEEKLKRLNNIVLIPQIYLPVIDQYGPTKRYKVRQDIPFNGGFHLFFWPLEPLYAEARNGWIWVTVESGFNTLPKNPAEFADLPEAKENRFLETRLFPDRIPVEEGKKLLESTRKYLLNGPKAPLTNKGDHGKKFVDLLLASLSKTMADTELITMALERGTGSDLQCVLQGKVRAASETSQFLSQQKGIAPDQKPSSKLSWILAADLFPNSGLRDLVTAAVQLDSNPTAETNRILEEFKKDRCRFVFEGDMTGTTMKTIQLDSMRLRELVPDPNITAKANEPGTPWSMNFLAAPVIKQNGTNLALAAMLPREYQIDWESVMLQLRSETQSDSFCLSLLIKGNVQRLLVMIAAAEYFQEIKEEEKNQPKRKAEDFDINFSN